MKTSQEIKDWLAPTTPEGKKPYYPICEYCGAPHIVSSGRETASERTYYHLKPDEMNWMVFGQVVGILGGIMFIMAAMIEGGMYIDSIVKSFIH